MSPETIARLLEINRRFYEERSDDFSRTRQSAWPGWWRVFDHLFARATGSEVAVLDAGCGNGRLALALDARLAGSARSARYLGFDESRSLIDEARANLLAPGKLCSVTAQLEPCDLLSAEILGSFQLVALMGVVHHIPSHQLRKRIVDSLIRAVAPDGIFAVTLWQFGSRVRFQSKIAPWTEPAPNDLEPGDALLRFGDRSDSVRYCHFVDAGEERRLFDGCGEIVDTYEADGATGDLNRYLIIRPTRR